jgi:hypothetical protein
MTKTGRQSVVPTSTATQARVALFQPSQRPIQKTGEWIDTAWGRCMVSGRLGQRHADIIESLFFVAEKKRVLTDGGVEILVDPAKVRTTLSDSGYSHARLWSHLREIMAAVIEIQTNDFRVMGHIIDSVLESPATRPDPLTGGKRHMWRVRIGSAFVGLIGADLHIYRDPAPIARLQHGITQAVARHILTHTKEPRGGWHIDNIIEVVSGGEITNQSMRDGRRRIRAESAKLLDLGISIDGDRIRKN